MKKTSWLLFLLCFGLVECLFCHAVAVAQNDAVAQDSEKQEAETEEEKLIREYEEFETEIKKEIARREEHAERGADVLLAYRQELTTEYLENAEKLVPKLPGHQAANDQPALERRQKVIALYLWQLDRLEPMVEAKVIGTEDLQEQIRNRMALLQRAGRTGDQADQLNQRCQMLYQMMFDLEHRRHNHPAGQMRQDFEGFYEVRPQLGSGDTEESDDGKAAGSLNRTFESGPLTKASRPLRRMLKLRWSGKSLSLDRDHWNDLFADKTLAEVAADVRRAFKDRGIELFYDSNDQAPFPQVAWHPNVCLLFQNLQYFVTRDQRGGGGSSLGGGDSQWHLSFETGQLHAMLRLNEDTIDLEIRENKSPDRSLRVFSRNDDTLRISLLGERMLYLEQRADGRVRLLEVYDDEMLHATGDSFLDVYSQHPDFIEVSLLPLLENLGFIPPETRFSPRVTHRLVELARVMQTDATARFDQLLKDLDSASYESRDAAGRELERHLDLYAGLVEDAYRNIELSLEVRSRLKRALLAYEKGPRELDEFIAQLKLLGDPRYLANLLPRLAEQDVPAITQRLEQLTGKPYGTDVAAWQAWLELVESQRSNSRVEVD